jgi:transcriptional regulator with XRE-family HTH domain
MARSLKDARRASGLSQNKLATLIGSTEGVVREIEAQRKPMSIDMAQRLGDVLEVDAVALYARHVLDEWCAELATIDLDSFPVALVKIRRALARYGELMLLDGIPDDLVIEARDLAQKTAKVLAVISASTLR